MKNLIVLLFFFCLYLSSSAQVTQIPNNGFELLNADGSLQNWGNVYIFSVSFDSLGNSVHDSIAFEDGYFYRADTNAFSGRYALLLSNALNLNKSTTIEGSASVDEDSVFTAWGSFETVNYHQRPQNFRFYYKFLPENNDTAVVTLSFFDEWGNPLCEVNHLITEPQLTYKMVDIPLTYYTPNGLVTAFSLNFSAFYTAEPNGLRQCSKGTRLWIDEVSFDGITGISTPDIPNIVSVFPNPATYSFTVKSQEQVKSISVKDLNGKNITVECPNPDRIDCSQWAKGIYFIQAETEKGVFTQKLRVE